MYTKTKHTIAATEYPQHITICLYIPLHDSTYFDTDKKNFNIQNIPIIIHSYRIIPPCLMFYVYIHKTNNPSFKLLLPFELIIPVFQHTAVSSVLLTAMNYVQFSQFK